MKIIIKKNNGAQEELIDFDQIKEILLKYKIEVDNVGVDYIDIDKQNSENPAELKTYIENYKNQENYASSDTVELDSNTPQKILDPFKDTHHHTDDEVRFTVEGEGIFGIVPSDEEKAAHGSEIEEIEILCSKGDLIKIPAYTRHWFKLTEQNAMKCVRIFKENPKWEAIY